MKESSSAINRRSFIRLTGITGAGLFLGLAVTAEGKTFIQKLSSEGAPAAASPFELTPFVNIEKNGLITIYNPRPEIGQGVFQSVPALVAEELELSLGQVTIKQTDGSKKFGRGQSVGGSASIRTGYKQMRQVGAAAKAMLIGAASQEWNVPAGECYAEDAKIFHKPTGKSLGYGELAEAASKIEVPQNPALKDPKDFKILGKPSPRPDVPLKSTGKAMFGIDVAVPGMVHASIERCPVFGAKLVSYDATEAKKVKGVLGVETTHINIRAQKTDGVAVIAENYWAALQGRKALVVKWDYQGNETFNSKDYDQSLRDAAKEEGAVAHEQGDFDRVYNEAPVKVEAFYETPVVSHSPIEPMNCTASWQDNNQLEIWASTQVPGSIMSDIPRTYNIPAENVKLNVMFAGGGFGRRLNNDFVHEAVQLSKKVGKPVKVIWTREDDTKMGPFRPMTYSALKGALSPDGKTIAFQHKVISPNMRGTKDYDKTKADGSMTEGISDQAYEIPNMKNLYVFHYLHVPLAAWRSVTSSTLAFAHEGFIDELAVKAKADPMTFRLQMLPKQSSTRNILQKLKEVSGWDKPLPAGSGRGVAQYEFFAGQCGYVVEVSQKGTGVKIDKVFAVIDLGTVVNPDTVEAQVQGAAVMALTAAIKGGITFQNGQTVQNNFNNNQLVRIYEMPVVEVHILTDSGERIRGVGEPGVPSFAPALCNAIYAATGKRIRKLPFDINKIA